MKYALISLAALTLWTGAASAADKKWPCIDLHANWIQAPAMQCPQLYLEGEKIVNRSRNQEYELKSEDREVSVAE
jgi:hypothetical protein